MIIIGIPAYNEEKNIAKIILKLRPLADKIIVCNDGSDDFTSEISKEMGADVINHKKNIGYGGAIRSLFLRATELNADVFVTFDADGQHRIEDVSKLLEQINKKESDIVIGSRFLNNKSDIPKYRKIGIKAITKLTNITGEMNITDSQSGLRAYNKKAIQSIIPSENGMGISTEILIKANKKNLKIKEIPIKILYDGDTSTHHPVSHGVSVIFSTMKFISIEHPLKFYGTPGIIFLFIGLFFTVWTIQAFTETRQIFTNIALIGIGSIIFGTILSMTAIILFSMVNVVRERKN